MGNNQAYAFFESTVVGLYDKGLLTVEVLDAVAEPYRGSDIDSGGSQELEAADGKQLEDIVFSLLLPDYAVPPEWQDDEGEYRYEEFHTITSGRWGWR